MRLWSLGAAAFAHTVIGCQLLVLVSRCAATEAALKDLKAGEGPAQCAWKLGAKAGTSLGGRLEFSMLHIAAAVQTRPTRTSTRSGTSVPAWLPELPLLAITCARQSADCSSDLLTFAAKALPRS
jgi:hypothetical protein